MRILDIIMSIPGIALAAVFVSIPVSYTHLDVYKRQALNSSSV